MAEDVIQQLTEIEFDQSFGDFTDSRGNLIIDLERYLKDVFKVLKKGDCIVIKKVQSLDELSTEDLGIS